MIIDCHGHYTTAPGELQIFRDRQLAALTDATRRPADNDLGISDDQIRESLEGAQLKLQRERGTDLTIFSPRAAGMAHHFGDEATGRAMGAHLQRPDPPVGAALPRELRGRVPAAAGHRACRPRTASPSWSAA